MGSPILELIVGIIFLYSILSILVTEMNSIIANAFRLRARNLRNAIADMLQDSHISAKLLGHSLIGLIQNQPVLTSQTLEDEQAHAITHGKVNDVSWINPSTFVNVLVSIIRVDSDNKLFGALLDIIDQMPSSESRRRLRLQINHIMRSGEGMAELRQMIAELPDSSYQYALTKALADVEDQIASMGLEGDSIVSLLAGLRQINNPYLREALDTILDTSRNLDEAKMQLEEWFNERMDRASQTYKKWNQILAVLIGTIIAVVLNVDTIFISRILWEDPALRSEIASIARTTDLAALEARQTAAQQSLNQALGNTSPEAEANTDPANETDFQEETDPLLDVENALAAASQTLGQLLELRLPLGWEYQNPNTLAEGEFRVAAERNLWALFAIGEEGWAQLVFLKILGIAGSIIAIAQGAPFWFGVLRQLSGKSSG